MLKCGSRPHSISYDYYRKVELIDDVISERNADELVRTGGFFKDRTTINYSLEQAKENESFNAIMIEKAYFTVTGNNIYTKNPVISLLDEVNIIAIKASKFLQNEIDKGNPNYVKAGSILDQLIVAELNGVNASDINFSDWVNENLLTKAMKSCISENHDQANIDTVISDRVIQYYQYKMDEHSSLDLDRYVKVLTDALVSTASGFNADKPTSANRDLFIAR